MRPRSEELPPKMLQNTWLDPYRTMQELAWETSRNFCRETSLLCLSPVLHSAKEKKKTSLVTEVTNFKPESHEPLTGNLTISFQHYQHCGENRFRYHCSKSIIIPLRKMVTTGTPGQIFSHQLISFYSTRVLCSSYIITKVHKNIQT